MKSPKVFVTSFTVTFAITLSAFSADVPEPKSWAGQHCKYLYDSKRGDKVGIKQAINVARIMFASLQDPTIEPTSQGDDSPSDGIIRGSIGRAHAIQMQAFEGQGKELEAFVKQVNAKNRGATRERVIASLKQGYIEGRFCTFGAETPHDEKKLKKEILAQLNKNEALPATASVSEKTSKVNRAPAVIDYPTTVLWGSMIGK